ncbi:MAG TPA: aminotransferase class V-fold PLP-dependent enzyme [Chitinophagaceae bacterium]|nr:aminotransferase class V-fold PLP-dependent enzyme [Chitinophagaceae bacterium]
MNTILTDEEVSQLRAETKGTRERIHFNNAGASLPPDVVVDTVTGYLYEEALYGGYETEYMYRDKLDNTYTSIARLINASVNEIAVMENASTGWCIAFNGMELKNGDEIITCEMEYATNVLGFLHAKKAAGVKVKIIPNDAEGNFCLEELEQAITPQTKLIAATHIGSAAGNVMPVAAIGKIARRHNITYLLDACQSIGHAPVDVNEIQCDMLSVTGRKYLRAPRGTGFLYVRKEVQDNLSISFMDGFGIEKVSSGDYSFRKDARRFELYEKNRALTFGLGKAVDYVLAIGIDKIWQRVQYLAQLLRNGLSQITGVKVYDNAAVKSGIVTFSVKGIDDYTVKNKLSEKNINVSVGRAQTTLYYMEKYGLESVVRASVHYYNTKEEIDTLCKVLLEICAGN